MENKNWAEAVKLSEPWLVACPVDARIHWLRSLVLEEQWEKEEADKHKKWFVGLIESVMSSGDGKTPETAYETISVGEEYAVLMALRLDFKKQRLITRLRVDEMTVENEQGEELKVFFSPKPHFRRLEKLFSN